MNLSVLRPLVKNEEFPGTSPDSGLDIRCDLEPTFN